MGSLADRDGDLQAEEVKGIMVTHNFQRKSWHEDLATYTPLRVGSIASKLHVPFAGSVDTLKLFLNEMFVGVTQTTVTNDDNDYDDKDSMLHLHLQLQQQSLA
ncbi:Pre-mRNA 3'-end-processing endonuclease polyadenylation factor C-term [Fragilaria crotonensis]|nr:Pre-mRNA 3'-end-processing endonuclease polyadenylation factor C-term [Fragilaria crotonensis]